MIPTDMLRWMEMEFALWQLAVEKAEETNDKRWWIAAINCCQTLQRFSDAIQDREK